MMKTKAIGFALVFCVAVSSNLLAEVGDGQIRTDHPWYPGELACSSFERLQATQAEVYERVTGAKPSSDQDKVLAAWLWRNTHYAHGEEGAEDLWGQGFGRGPDTRAREYWTGLFAHGFGLCGTTHSQWIAEMEALLGHSRGRGVGVSGHNSFEVFLKGGPYGSGRWALLDHDISTVIFDEEGKSLLSLKDVQPNWKKLTDRSHTPQRQQGWLVCGLDKGDGGVYASYQVAEYLAGYSGPEPIVHLRRGESLRRYHQPGLADGKTFVFWGRNYNTAGIPGPERSQTWVNQPEKMHGSKEGTSYKPGQARYANAVYTYRPDFASGDYKEGVISENGEQVTFEFYTPYIIAATPPNDSAWGIYETGCKNGLVLTGRVGRDVSISVDQGATWKNGGRLDGSLDLTDLAKGHRQYLLRLHASASQLAKSELTMTTICQVNSAILPRLKDGGSSVSFAASGRGIVSAGPNLPQAQAHVVEGKFGSPSVTLELKTPRGEPAVAIYASAHIQSGNPPRSETKYAIDFSTDGGKTWQPVVKDWQITRQGDEPADYWSQSMCWGSSKIENADCRTVRVRFRNDGGKNYARAEAHLVYRTKGSDATRVTFAWTDDAGEHQESPVFAANSPLSPPDGSWKIATGKGVRTQWVEMTPVTP